MNEEQVRPSEPLNEAEATEARVAGMVAENGSYDLLRQRLMTQGEHLLRQTQSLNAARLEQFGRADLGLLCRTSARTENNCVARDIVRIGSKLLFGYNVFIGLRKETAVEDVFALYRLSGEEEGAEGGIQAETPQMLEPLPLAGTFLEDPRFVSDFRELYAYYKNATLIQLRVTQDKLLAAFQIGQQLHDLRVFRWHVAADGSLEYQDNRGERDFALPPTHDFEWVQTGREDQVGGRHPHVNILDTVFVETVGGDLTVKVENNTETGLGIYSEPVEDKNQSLADAEIAYARVGQLILLQIRPYREQRVRYLVFNPRTQKVERIDALGVSCIQLPEDHGIIFPGGYYLQTGEYKHFDLPESMRSALRFKRVLRAPNGEDVLYVFYHQEQGNYALFSYNVIDKRLSAPIIGNGYARFADGRILVCQADTSEPARVHPMQLWQTPFSTEEYAGEQRGQAGGQGFFARIGNAELVRGISDLMAVGRAVHEQLPLRASYQDLIRQCSRLLDVYFWLGDAEADGLAEQLVAIREGAEATLHEFEKVDLIRRETGQALTHAEGACHNLLAEIAAMLWHRPDDFIGVLDRLRQQRGSLHTLRELRYADPARIELMEKELGTEQQRVGERALQFLKAPGAFDLYRHEIDKTRTHLSENLDSEALGQHLAGLDRIAAGLDLLSEQLGSLPGGDAVVRTAILDRISSLYADVNRLRAEIRNRRKAVGSAEQAAEFGAQFKLFGQALENALEFADTPERCDDALTRLLAQLEELEGRFIDQDAFVADIAVKREAVYEALAGRRQSLMEARQGRIQALVVAGGRILEGIPRRLAQLDDPARLHAYFAADPLIAKLRQQLADLRALGAAVAADDLETRLKTAQDQALRLIRDRSELVTEDGTTLRFGRHLFTISRQGLDLTLVPQGEQLHYHLTGTDYFTPVQDEALDQLKPFWGQMLVSETPELYRGEYLAGLLLEAVLKGEAGLSWDELQVMAMQEGLAQLEEQVRLLATRRYQEAYQKGVHDRDATLILAALIRMQAGAGLLAWSPAARAVAQLYWQYGTDAVGQESRVRHAVSALRLFDLFSAPESLQRLEQAWGQDLIAFMLRFVPAESLPAVLGVTAGQLPVLAREAAAYLIRQLAESQGAGAWVISGEGEDLANALNRELEQRGNPFQWERELETAAPLERWSLVRDWVLAYVRLAAPESGAWVEDATCLLALGLPQQRMNAVLQEEVTGLLGAHSRIEAGCLQLNLNDFWLRFRDHQQRVVPAFAALQDRKQTLLAAEKARLHLEQFQAKPLSTFVRNRLVDEVYLPIVGDNLARQIGSSGAGNRTDRMGMLLLISPPGYGKTTLMEYVADRLGLIFVRINCPVLGHGVTDLDPASVQQGAARQELEKLNLGLAMGSNVMLYLDDIQHTHPEFLQKFIALADGTRRIEGVWRGQPRTYDLRGKRFAIVMAGNPYTESGEVFRIPDMLANRADIYNLGDVLSGREALFALSYIENSLTSNPLLLPLASRDPRDVHLLVRLAAGEEIPASDFSHPYSMLELEELSALLRHLFRVRDVLLKVNLAYIESAAQKDDYRTEPPFKLQGSYRNMNKLASRITALMRPEELDALLRDHYRGEAQTLTTGAEENLLKLAELLGSMGADEKERWQAICDEFVRQRKLGGAGLEGSARIAATLLDVARAVDGLHMGDGLARIAAGLQEHQPVVQVQGADLRELTALLAGMNEVYEKTLVPLVSANYHKLRMDHSLWRNMKEISEFIRGMDTAQDRTPESGESGGAGSEGDF